MLAAAFHTSHMNGWPLDLWSLRHFEEPMSSPFGALLRYILLLAKLE